jgi:hypothetical protein
MPSIAIKVLGPGEKSVPTLERISDEVRSLAYSLVQKRGCAAGHALDDWIEAERGLIYSPPAGIEERDKHFSHSDDVDQSFRSDADQNGAKRRRTLSV